MHPFDSVRRKRLAEFASSRLNSDGGYSFSCPLHGFEFPSSVSETFYALSVLSLLGEEIPSKNRTLEYLRNIQRPEGTYDSISAAFYAVQSLELLGKKPENPSFIPQLRSVLREFRLFRESYGDKFFSADYDMAGSPFRLAYQASKTLHSLGEKISEEEVSWILPENEEGGFGQGRSDTISTYHAVSALHCGNKTSGLKKTPAFISSCTTPGGGYSQASGCMPPYVESTCFAIATLNLLGVRQKEKRRNINFLVSLQNADGGFRRSPYLGISTLCNSYFAIKALSMLEGDGD
ncbi:MAG: prenyltransferase/squalene oxidase repeat-containing protein [Candidatus Bilamarchaeaceae archaeon]